MSADHTAAPPTAPPPSTRSRLLQAGLARAKQAGLRALTVRGVTADAGANLGSFVHHFGTREAFIAELIEHWYAPLTARTNALLPGGSLRELVLGIADWMLGERSFMGHLVMDAAAGEAAAVGFLRSIGNRHPALVLRAIVEAQARGELRAADPVAVLLALLSVTGLPVLLFEGLGAQRFLPEEFGAAFQSYALDRTHIAQRIDWLLAGLAA